MATPTTTAAAPLTFDQLVSRYTAATNQIKMFQRQIAGLGKIQTALASAQAQAAELQLQIKAASPAPAASTTSTPESAAG